MVEWLLLATVAMLPGGPEMRLDMELAPWQAVNDGVMGGISRGRMVSTEDGLRFEGELSLENNGGFASVRRPVDADLSAAGSVRLEVRGDGRTYQFRLRLDKRYDGVAWRAEFATSGEWQTIDLPFDEFVPVFRGRRVPEAGPVIAADIGQAGFMLADKTAGAFALDIRSIEFR
jgi:monofunctional biosynthetic peptidoglycan transglycosylase